MTKIEADEMGQTLGIQMTHTTCNSLEIWDVSQGRAPDRATHSKK